MAWTPSEKSTTTEPRTLRTWGRKEVFSATLVGALTPCLLWLALLGDGFLSLLFFMLIVPPMWPLALGLLVLIWALLLIPLFHFGVARAWSVAFVAVIALLGLSLCAPADTFLNEPLMADSWGVIGAPSVWVWRTVLMCVAGALGCALTVVMDRKAPGFFTVGAVFLLLCLLMPAFATVEHRATVERVFDRYEYGVAVADPQWQPHSLELDRTDELVMSYTRDDQTVRVENLHPDSTETTQGCGSCEQQGGVAVRRDEDEQIQQVYLTLEDGTPVLVSPPWEEIDEEAVIAFAQGLELASPQERAELRGELARNTRPPS